MEGKKSSQRILNIDKMTNNPRDDKYRIYAQLQNKYNQN